MIFLWVTLYGLIYILSGEMSKNLHIGSWITPMAMVFYAGALLFWIYKTGQLQDIGICAVWHVEGKEYWYFLPLFLLPAFNLLTLKISQIDILTVILMLSVSLTEEIFFRGFLLHWFMKRSKLAGILMSSAVFALFHCVNLFHSVHIIYTLLQVACAFAVGVCFGAVVVQYRSLIPCMIAHFFTNITGVGSLSYEISGWEILGLCICIVAYTCYGIGLCRKINNK